MKRIEGRMTDIRTKKVFIKSAFKNEEFWDDVLENVQAGEYVYNAISIALCIYLCNQFPRSVYNYDDGIVEELGYRRGKYLFFDDLGDRFLRNFIESDKTLLETLLVFIIDNDIPKKQIASSKLLSELKILV